jgi:hypothetical protein
VVDICLAAALAIDTLAALYAPPADAGGLVEKDSCFVSASPRLDSLPALFLELKWSLVRLILFLLLESRFELSVAVLPL